jgi:hypothetical protein
MMRHRMRWMIGLALLTGGAALFLFLRGPSLQRQASAIQEDVTRIRGRSFVSPVVARFRSREDTKAAVDAHLTPLADTADYAKVVRKLGLYNGPLIDNRRAILRQLTTSAPEGGIGEYDHKLDVVFVERNARGKVPLERLAHEVYHAFQHQHFDLASYLIDKAVDGTLNADEAMARRAVVEGDATYVALIWGLQRAKKGLATPQLIAQTVKRRSRVDREDVLETLSQPNAPTQSRALLDAIKRAPAFMYDSLYVPYRDGAVFVWSVQQAGWDEVDKLYSEYPPQSTEQILHPEKWFARDEPARVKWPAWDTNPLFAEWNVVADHVLGEALWRSVFKEQDLSDDAAAAAEGWGGDRYAVLERARDGALLLLWHTTWDTPADASQFARTYRRLLIRKYARTPEPVRVKERGHNVFIVEGGDETSIDAYVDFVEQVL